MIYTQEELQQFGNVEEDSHLKDKSDTIKSEYVRILLIMYLGTQEDDEEFSDWTIRKCSSEGLDYLSRPFEVSNAFLETLLPLIEGQLKQDDNWLSKESSILALGCVSVGQHQQIQSFLPGIIPFLFEQTNHPRPLIRSVSCWVLSRYSNWIFQQVCSCSCSYF